MFRASWGQKWLFLCWKWPYSRLIPISPWVTSITITDLIINLRPLLFCRTNYWIMVLLKGRVNFDYKCARLKSWFLLWNNHFLPCTGLLSCKVHYYDNQVLYRSLKWLDLVSGAKYDQKCAMHIFNHKVP